MYNVIKTVMTYPLNGSNKDFHIPFEYLARGFIQVTLLGKDRKVLTINQDYRFTTKTTISTTKSWGDSDGYTLIEVRRFTSASDRLVNFEDGSILRSHDLNLAQIQAMHIAEEARDLTADTIGVNQDGYLDARGRRIINLGDGVEGFNDAINMKQVGAWNASALNSANRSSERADFAAKKANDANTHRGAAEGYRNEARSSSELARDWAVKTTTVADGHQSARTYSFECRASETNARNSANEAKSQADRSTERADFSSKKANDANTWRMRSEESAKASKASEDRARAEANKLGNWNALAGTIKEIKDGWVRWDNSLSAPNMESNFVKSLGDTVVEKALTAGSVHTRNDVHLPNAVLGQDGNLSGNLWRTGGVTDLKGFIEVSDNLLRNELKGIINQLVEQVKVELGEKYHGIRRGNLQDHYQNNREEWEAPSGYLTGARNVIQNGNIRYTSWRFRTIQAYSNKYGWVDVA